MAEEARSNPSGSSLSQNSQDQDAAKKELICLKCSKVIEHVPYKYLGETFHAVCIICNFCARNLVAKPFIIEDSRIFCSDHCKKNFEGAAAVTTEPVHSPEKKPNSPEPSSPTEDSAGEGESLIEVLENIQEGSEELMKLSRKPSPLDSSNNSINKGFDPDRLTDYPRAQSPESMNGSRRSSLSLSAISETSLTSDGSSVYSFDANKWPKKKILKNPHRRHQRKHSKNRVHWNLPGGEDSDTASLQSFDSLSTTSEMIYTRARSGVTEVRQGWKEFEKEPPYGSTGLTPARKQQQQQHHLTRGYYSSSSLLNSSLNSLSSSPTHSLQLDGGGASLLQQYRSHSASISSLPSSSSSTNREHSQQVRSLFPLAVSTDNVAPSSPSNRHYHRHHHHHHPRTLQSTPKALYQSDSVLVGRDVRGVNVAPSPPPSAPAAVAEADRSLTESGDIDMPVLRLNSSNLTDLEESTVEDRKRMHIFQFPQDTPSKPAQVDSSQQQQQQQQQQPSDNGTSEATATTLLPETDKHSETSTKVTAKRIVPKVAPKPLRTGPRVDTTQTNVLQVLPLERAQTSRDKTLPSKVFFDDDDADDYDHLSPLEETEQSKKKDGDNKDPVHQLLELAGKRKGMDEDGYSDQDIEDALNMITDEEEESDEASARSLSFVREELPEEPPPVPVKKNRRNQKQDDDDDDGGGGDSPEGESSQELSLFIDNIEGLNWKTNQAGLSLQTDAGGGGGGRNVWHNSGRAESDVPQRAGSKEEVEAEEEPPPLPVKMRHRNRDRTLLSPLLEDPAHHQLEETFDLPPLITDEGSNANTVEDILPPPPEFAFVQPPPQTDSPRNNWETQSDDILTSTSNSTLVPDPEEQSETSETDAFKDREGATMSLPISAHHHSNVHSWSMIHHAKVKEKSEREFSSDSSEQHAALDNVRNLPDIIQTLSLPARDDRDNQSDHRSRSKTTGNTDSVHSKKISMEMAYNDGNVLMSSHSLLPPPSPPSFTSLSQPLPHRTHHHQSNTGHHHHRHHHHHHHRGHSTKEKDQSSKDITCSALPAAPRLASLSRKLSSEECEVLQLMYPTNGKPRMVKPLVHNTDKHIQDMLAEINSEENRKKRANPPSCGTCRRCGQSVQSSKELCQFDGLCFHAKCYSCSMCNVSLQGRRIHRVRTTLLCSSCYPKYDSSSFVQSNGNHRPHHQVTSLSHDYRSSSSSSGGQVTSV